MKTFTNFLINQGSAKNDQQSESELNRFKSKRELRRNGNAPCRQIRENAALPPEMKQAPCFRGATEQHQGQQEQKKSPRDISGVGLNLFPSASRIHNQHQGSDHPRQL